ncbi:MAG: hypothetical protein LC620_00295 [Halobacteriales archaeon]|nr:hypothetical protein [Halobacteriales archaeon]
MPPEARLQVGLCDVLALGTLAGFVPEGDRVRAAFAAHVPDTVALGVPPEDLPGLEGLWKAEGAREQLAEPDAASERLLKVLSRFGATRIPSPDLEVAFALARAGGIPVVAVDLDDAAHSAAYVQRVKVRHLWWAPRREAKLLARDFGDAKDPYELAAAWDAEANASRPLRQVEALREAAMADGVRTAAAVSRRLLAILPAPRLAGVVARLGQATMR